MEANALLLIYSALFVGVLLLVEGGYNLLRDLRDPRVAVNRRLRMLASGQDPEELLRLLRRHQPDRGLMGRLGLYRWMDTLVLQSGARVTTTQVLLFMAGLAGALLVLLRVATTVPWLPSVVFALTTAVSGPLLCLIIVRRRRVIRFGQQLPDTLDLMVRSLRAGHPLAAALNVVAQELPDPVGTEFGIVVDETNYGLSIQDAVENLSARVGHRDLHYFVVAIRIQYGTGGNLAEVLAGLATVIRARFTMDKKIRAISAEGRLSAVVLSLMPVGTAGAIMLMGPSYYLSVANDPLFPGFVYATIVLIVINLVVMHKLVRFRY